MAKTYAQLLDTYRKMFGMVDAFHFNSQNTANVYGKYLDIPTTSEIIPITHSGIQDHRRVRDYDVRLLRLGFIGSEAPYKGLPMLKDVIGMLNKEGYTDKIILHVYGGRTGMDSVMPNVLFKGRFTSDMMEQVFDDMDLLVVPSIWNETFSLVTLEALSYGTCVLVSDKVGAKDIVKKYSLSFAFEKPEDLFGLLKRLIADKTLLYEYQNNLLKDKWNYSIKNHAEEIVTKMYK